MKTLKILIIIGFTLVSGLKLQAQDIEFGILSGLVVTNASVSDKVEAYEDYRVFYPMVSFNINGYIEYKISNTWGIAAEPGFIRKGGVVRFGVNHYMSEIKLQLYYGGLMLYSQGMPKDSRIILKICTCITGMAIGMIWA